MSENKLAITKHTNTRPSALAVMAGRLNIEPEKLMTTLKATVFKNANDSEIAALVLVSNEYSLNPFLKEIYAFPAKGGGIVPIVSVDGWNKMLLRQPDFDGIEFAMAFDEEGMPVSCEATIYVKSRSKPVKITEYFSECYRKTDPWENMPRRMLRNRTLCQASRVAFGFSGIYHEDEAQPIIDVQELPPKRIAVAVESAPKESQPEGISAQDELAKIVTDGGFTFDEFCKWGDGSGNVPDATSLASFTDVKLDIAKRLIRNPAGLLKGLSATKGTIA